MLKLHQIDVASVRAAREAVGPEVELMLDTNCPWDSGRRHRHGACARPLSPVLARGAGVAARGLRRAWRASPHRTDTPIALGENESTAFGFREIIAHRAGQILQPSITKVGGISEMKKIAALAQSAGLTVVPHSFYFGPGLAATLHVAATFGGSAPIEFPTGEMETPFLHAPDHREGRLGGRADRPRPRRRGERGGHPPIPVRRRARPSPSC